MGERTKAPRRAVTGTEPHGKRCYLLLTCGHIKLHQGRNPVPKHSHCDDCLEGKPVVPPVVTKADERPNRMDGTCFFCGRAIGTRHQPNCVTWTRPVIVEMTVRFRRDVPVTWDKQMVEFSLNEGSWCASNVLDHELADLEKKHGCLCPVAKFRYVKEADID